MAGPDRALMQRKLASLRRFIDDLRPFAALDAPGRLSQHYAIERLLQLLCEASADTALQLLKSRGDALPSSYREIFAALVGSGDLPEDMGRELIAACGMRNVLTHLYDSIDLDRVIGSVEPAIALYERFLAWALARS